MMPDTSAQSNPWSRIPVYPPERRVETAFDRFKIDTGNSDFRRSTLTWVMLGILLLVYPGLSLGFMEDPSELLRNLTPGMLMVLLLYTIIMQWGLFLILFGTMYRENTGLRGLNLGRIRWIHLAWAIAFLVASNLLLSGLAWLLAQVGLPMHGEIQLLVPTDLTGRIVWVLVSFTAGFCEEAFFRGYLMTRLRLLGRFSNWIIPALVSAVAFGACHAYQGWAGLVVLSVYGLMFSALYVRTGSLWPCIIAHFFQDFSALFIPR